jgi:hypothetical protein
MLDATSCPAADCEHQRPRSDTNLLLRSVPAKPHVILLRTKSATGSHAVHNQRSASVTLSLVISRALAALRDSMFHLILEFFGSLAIVAIIPRERCILV